MLDSAMIELSRWQFASTAMYHFLFVPLTLGLTWILVIMESVYVMTGREIYRDMTKFWGKLFGINFALGVTTGLTMEFQFGMNWSYYSHYVGDVFGAPLAIEGLMAFFLESTFIGLFFLGWERLTKRQHLAVTFLMAVGSNLSAMWILIANGWMQNPVGLGVQLRDHAHGDDELLGGAAESRRAGQVRAHRGRRLRDRGHVRRRYQRLLHAQGPRHGVCQAVVLGGCGLWPGLDPVRDPARRRVRLRGRRRAEGEAGSHRGGVGHRAGPRRVHRLRLPEQRGRRDAHGGQDPLCAGPDRDPLPRRGGAGPQGPDAPTRGAHSLRHDRLRVLCSACATAKTTTTTAAPSRTIWTTWATGCC